MRIPAACIGVVLYAFLPYWARADGVTAAPADASVAAAAQAGQSGALRHLLQQGGNPRAVDSHGLPAIALAVLSKDADTVRALLEADAGLANTSYADKNGGRQTVLIASAFMRSPAVTAELVRSGADLRATDSSDVNALLAAAYTGDVETTKLLLDAGVDPNLRDHRGTTPLAMAASTGHVEVARLLLDRGAWPYPLDAWGLNAYAHAKHDIKDPAVAQAMVSLLAEHHAPVTNTNRPVDAEYLEAIHRGDLAAVKAALAKGADVNARRLLTLDNGRCEVVSLAVPNLGMLGYLIDHGADAKAVSQAGFNALHIASGRIGTPASVEFLVRHGLDVNATSNAGDTPLHTAVNQGVPATVELLLKLGANARASGPGGTNLLDLARQANRSPRIASALVAAGATAGGPETPAPCALTALPIPPCAMFISADVGNADRVRKGLEAGLDPNLRDAAGRSLLEVALVVPVPGTSMGAPAPLSAFDEHRLASKIAIAKLLIERGADVGIADRTGATPLHRVASDPRLSELVAPLLAKGAPVNATATDQHLTPLLLAVGKGNLPVVRQLLAAGADPNLATAHGVTALMGASLSQPAPLVAALLAAGAKVDVASDAGVTALKAAVSAGKAESVALLLQAGANPDYDGGRPPTPRAMSAGKGAEIERQFLGLPAAR